MYGTDSEDAYHHMAYSQHCLDSFLSLFYEIGFVMTVPFFSLWEKEVLSNIALKNDNNKKGLGDLIYYFSHFDF